MALDADNDLPTHESCRIGNGSGFAKFLGVRLMELHVRRYRFLASESQLQENVG